jgi:hypothetical protein
MQAMLKPANGELATSQQTFIGNFMRCCMLLLLLLLLLLRVYLCYLYTPSNKVTTNYHACSTRMRPQPMLLNS